jgi:predicted CopG family antitoxin
MIMFKQKISIECIAGLVMFLLTVPSITYSAVTSEEEQQEESFSESVQELTERKGDIPVYSHIYGADFMTEQERCNYLLKLDGMKTKEERAAFREQHRKEIDMRRKEKGG